MLQGDFYTFEPDGAFDLILYLDGFGVGSDDQQRRLLRRIRGWLAPGGCAVLELYTPWYAAMVAGRGWPAGEAERRYGFDADACCWLDRWWPRGQPDEYVEQRLRCYSPADLRLLLEPTGLICDRVVPGGRVDWESHRFVDRAPLGEAMSWFARLTPA